MAWEITTEDTKPLPEPMLTYHHWALLAFIPGKIILFKYSRYQHILIFNFWPFKHIHWETIDQYSRIISMALCKPAVAPLLKQWRYCSLALSHRFVWSSRTWVCAASRWQDLLQSSWGPNVIACKIPRHISLPLKWALAMSDWPLSRVTTLGIWATSWSNNNYYYLKLPSDWHLKNNLMNQTEPTIALTMLISNK